MIEREFDIPFVAGLALREKQIQQNYRPIIAVHKWFARRPGTLFRSLLLAEFGKEPIRKCFFQSNQLHGIRIADPFMGGGTPLIEANRLGCDVLGYDVNPMAYWIVRQEIEWLDLEAYEKAAAALVQGVMARVGDLYQTRCRYCSSANAPVKYFLWVKTMPCVRCGYRIDLFPGYLVSEDRRHPRNVFVCPDSKCGELTQTESRKSPGACHTCQTPLQTVPRARKNRCACPGCGVENQYPSPQLGSPEHRLFALEYHCLKCKQGGYRGRFFKKPEADDLAGYEKAQSLLSQLEPAYIPDDVIPSGDETDRLHRWGYRHYREMFNARQLLGLEISARLIAQQRDERIRNALATNLSDLVRYQNMLCRYDTGVLKSLDIFSIHGFPVGLVQCESNLIGITNGSLDTDLFGESSDKKSINVGSGGWSNIIEKYRRAKAYCKQPFEVQSQRGRKFRVMTSGEWIGDIRSDIPNSDRREVDLRCGSATEAEIPAQSLDAVLTDPPYYGNVQYAELMDFCYVWLRRLVGSSNRHFQLSTTRHAEELTGNTTLDRGLHHFTEGLAEVFTRMAKALKPGAPLAFTFHHNTPPPYHAVAVAVLDAGLDCTASLPCPAEMAASVHINSTASSILDTVFVCRHASNVRRVKRAASASLIETMQRDISQLGRGGIQPTRGDRRCMLLGHLARMVINELRPTWSVSLTTNEKLGIVAKSISRIGDIASFEEQLTAHSAPALLPFEGDSTKARSS